MKRKIFLVTIFLLLPATAWLFYSGICIDGELRKGNTKFDYFSELAGSFMEGRLDVIKEKGGKVDDLVRYKGKYYLYWPPVPALFYIPLKSVFDGKIYDHLVTASFGALNTGLVALVIILLSLKYNINLRYREIIFLTIFWAFGTVHFYMSMTGAVWFMSQISAQTFLLAAIAVMLTGIYPGRLALSGLFFALAVYTRNNLVFSFFLFAAFYYTMNKNARIKAHISNAMIFLGFFFVFSFLNMWYNAARFDGRIFDNGINYHLMSDYFRGNFEKHGFFSPAYLLRNFYTEIIKPIPIYSVFPFFKYRPEGFGFLWASPLFFLLFPAGYYYVKSMKKRISAGNAVKNHELNTGGLIVMTGAALSTVFMSIVIFMIMGSGWMQFGARYTLDFYIMLLIFMLFASKVMTGRKIRVIASVLILLSVYLNYFGARFFHGYGI